MTKLTVQTSIVDLFGLSSNFAPSWSPDGRLAGESAIEVESLTQGTLKNVGPFLVWTSAGTTVTG
ncbi:MAG TPA: hypothetical protein VFA71_06255 [Terriglobales bacterium]|nr:hypothetical protein [Terriglobales bacterium]